MKIVAVPFRNCSVRIFYIFSIHSGSESLVTRYLGNDSAKLHMISQTFDHSSFFPT